MCDHIKKLFVLNYNYAD